MDELSKDDRPKRNQHRDKNATIVGALAHEDLGVSKMSRGDRTENASRQSRVEGYQQHERRRSSSIV